MVLEPSSSFLNAGTITGGAGYDFQSYPGGPGGAGAFISAATLYNTGIIRGGSGGNGSNGADGVELNGGLLTNHGQIIGGAAGTGANGGDGVVLNGGELANAGTITAGTGSAASAAMYLGTTAGTIVALPGAVFAGDVRGNAGEADVFALSGVSSKALAGFGTNITGFYTISFDGGARWKIAGNIGGITRPCAVPEDFYGAVQSCHPTRQSCGSHLQLVSLR